MQVRRQHVQLVLCFDMSQPSFRPFDHTKIFGTGLREKCSCFGNCGPKIGRFLLILGELTQKIQSARFAILPLFVQLPPVGHVLASAFLRFALLATSFFESQVKKDAVRNRIEQGFQVLMLAVFPALAGTVCPILNFETELPGVYVIVFRPEALVGQPLTAAACDLTAPIMLFTLFLFCRGWDVLLPPPLFHNLKPNIVWADFSLYPLVTMAEHDFSLI